jgi:predicted site-specific integrase-resolvase
MEFEYEYLPTIEDVRKQIKRCEGFHTQQVSFSTFHDALTQICFGCRCIRSNIKIYANNNKINSFKTDGEHRRFREDDLDTYMGVKKEKQERLTVIYARCSTAKQKENLERQKDRLRKHAKEKGYKYLMIDEIASGINEKRKGIHKLIKMCFEGRF